jgi:hypothetical protein
MIHSALGHKFLGVQNLGFAARQRRAVSLLRSDVKSRFDTPALS